MTVAARTLTIALFGVLFVGFLVVATGFSAADFDNLGTPRNALEVDGVLVSVPLPEGPATRRAGAVPVTTVGDYVFLDESEAGEPIRYDPCRVISWVLAAEGMPDGAEDLIHDAFAEVQERTGLVFEYEGVTDEVASFDRPLFQDRYGERFVPVVFGWSTATHADELRGDVAGIGGSTSVPAAYGEQRFLASGVVLMDTEAVEPLLGTNHTAGLVRAVMMHEIGHVVGLGHVDAPGELMHHDNMQLKTWGPGDLAGLAIAGSGPCQDA